MGEYLCIDIGGTAMKYAILTEAVPVQLDRVQLLPTAGGGPGIVQSLLRIGEECKASNLEGICISTAGMVDCDKGEIRYAAPLIPDYTGTKLKAILEESFGCPCEVENDVNCAGLAEYYAGAAAGCKTAVCLTVGTGIGGAVLFDGTVFHGYSGSACEVGYMNLPGGQWQDMAAASVMVKEVRKQLPAEAALEDINGEWIFRKAREGNPVCRSAIAGMADLLGMGIANICYVLNPEIVVLGGGVMEQKTYLEPLLRQSLKKHLLGSIAVHTRLAFAENGNRAGMLGAYFHFKQKRRER